MRAVAVIILCACAHVVPEAPSASTLRVTTEVADPYAVGSLVVLVDGDVVARSPGVLALRLAPGRHEIALAANVTRPCELGNERRELTRVRAAEQLEVNGGAVQIEAAILADAVNGAELEASVNGKPFSAIVAERGCCSVPVAEVPEPPRAESARSCRGADGMDVLVMGEVRHPREVKWRKGLTAYDAIGLAGGATALANLRYTVVRRPCGDRLAVLELPWYASVSTLELMPGDDVIVRMTPDP